MIIKKFTKSKNGMYLLTMDNNEKIKVHEDLILKYGLLLSKEISDDLIENINIENRVYEIYDMALEYINTKLRSRKELREYLIKKEYDVVSIDDVIDILSKQGYLDDKIYANSYVHDKILLSSYGPNKIKDDLKKLGIPDLIVNESILCFNEELEKERVIKLIDKQKKSNRNKGPLVLKKKIQIYLINLGYSSNIINQCLNSMDFKTKDIYEKEYQKIYNKLSKKYSGKELEYKLKQKLYQKGFVDFG